MSHQRLHVPACLHDHQLKDRPGWQLRQPRPGRFEWTSPTGHVYERPPQALFDELPDPDPPDQPSDDTPHWFATDEPIWDDVPPTRRPPPPPRREDRPPHTDPDDDPAPF